MLQGWPNGKSLLEKLDANNIKKTDIKINEMREYLSPEHLYSKQEPALAGALRLYLLFYASILWLTTLHIKENLEGSQTVTLTEICVQFLISSNAIPFTT
jgi:hypothetical protein